MSELPKGWATAKLPEVAFFQEGPGLRKYQYRESGVPFLNIRTLVNERVELSLCKFLDTDEVNSKYQHFLLREGDIVCSTSGTIGKTAIIQSKDLPLMLNTSIIRFKTLDSSSMSDTWIYYFLKSESFLLQVDKEATGTAQRNIGPSHLNEFYIPLPPLAEQTRIAQKLDELLAQVDTLKARLDAIPALLKRFRQSTLAAAVSGRLTSTSESLTFPASWKMVPLSAVLQDLRYGTAQKCDYNGGAVGVLRIPNIGDSEITLNDLKSSDFSEAEINKLSLQEGDILIIRSNGSVDLVGKSAVVGNKEVGLLYAGYLIRLRLNRDQALPAYVNFWLKSPTVRQVIEQTARSTSGVNNINSEEIKSLVFTMPPLAHQTEIVRRVEQLFAFTDQLEAKIKTAQTRINHLTQSILAKAFRGELVPQDPNDEPASELLARIQAQRTAAPKAKRGRKASA